jgi:hypothetical protein
VGDAGSGTPSGADRELFSLLNLLAPRTFADADAFEAKYVSGTVQAEPPPPPLAKPKAAGKGKGAEKDAPDAALAVAETPQAALQCAIAPYLLRRLKSAVLGDEMPPMPPMRETEASGRATISHAAQPSQSVAAGPGVDAESVAVTFSWRDPPGDKLARLRASAAHQLKAQGWTAAEIAPFVAGLGVRGTPPSSTVKDKQLALEELLDVLSGLAFYEDKKLFAALTAGLRAFREGDHTALLVCLKEPTEEGVCKAPAGAPTHTLEACVAKIREAAAARGEDMPELAHVDGADWAAQPLGATGDIIRAMLLALGPHADGVGFGDTYAHIVPFKEAQEISLQGNVLAPLEGAFEAAHAMLAFFVNVLGVRATVAMGVYSYEAWRGCIKRWAVELGKRSAVLHDVIETPIGFEEVEWTAAMLGEEQGVVAAARTGHAVLLHEPDEKTRLLGAFDLAAMLAGTPIPTERLEALALASSTFRGYLNPSAGGNASCEARGREELGLSGVPEGELDAVSAEDAMAWNGMVLGFGNLDKTFHMKQETAEKRGRFWWSPALVQSFNAAVEELGGLRAAKPTTILQKLLAAKSIPSLTRKKVNARLEKARIKAKK